VFRNPSARLFWPTFAFSFLGDALTRVALTWTVYERTGSATALGLLTVAYTAPILVGGLVAGSLLDRFDRRRVMGVDNAIRGLAVAAIPLLHALGRLELWHLYVVAAIYGLLMMISLAGGPSLIPSMVPKEQLSAANALETLSFTLGNVIGPPLAGLLIGLVGAPNVIILDAISYFALAAALLGLKLRDDEAAEQQQAMNQPQGMHQAVRLLLGNRVLLSTTLMFLTANVGFGLFSVWLPIYASERLGGGSEVFGLLLGVNAIGETASAVLAGNVRLPLSLGVAIALSQLLAGLSLGLLVLGDGLGWALPGLFLLGLFSAPLTIWAQTLRMRIIPEGLRGRTFALLRTIMQGATPLGGALGGGLLPVAGVVAMVGLTAAIIGTPGLLGMSVGELRGAGSPALAPAEGP
jgi:MFS family permease